MYFRFVVPVPQYNAQTTFTATFQTNTRFYKQKYWKKGGSRYFPSLNTGKNILKNVSQTNKRSQKTNG